MHFSDVIKVGGGVLTVAPFLFYFNDIFTYYVLHIQIEQTYASNRIKFALVKSGSLIT